jgi:hypothetical protein
VWPLADLVPIEAKAHTEGVIKIISVAYNNNRPSR